jgi:hypothetical protein
MIRIQREKVSREMTVGSGFNPYANIGNGSAYGKKRGGVERIHPFSN